MELVGTSSCIPEDRQAPVVLVPKAKSRRTCSISWGGFPNFKSLRRKSKIFGTTRNTHTYSGATHLRTHHQQYSTNVREKRWSNNSGFRQEDVRQTNRFFNVYAHTLTHARTHVILNTKHSTACGRSLSLAHTLTRAGPFTNV